MDEEYQYPMENLFRQARKGWRMRRMAIGVICLVGMFLPLFSNYSQETQKVSGEYHLVQLSEEDIRMSLERARGDILTSSESTQESMEKNKSGWTKSEEIVVRMEKVIVPTIVRDPGFFPPEFLELIRKKCIQVDPWFEQVPFENRLPKVKFEEEKANSGPRTTSFMKEVPVLEVLRLLAGFNGANLIIYKGTVYLIPKDETIEPIKEQVFFQIPADFFGDIPAGSNGRTIDAKKILMDRGVKFWKGTSAVYDPGKNSLKVANTQNQLEYIKSLILNESK